METIKLTYTGAIPGFFTFLFHVQKRSICHFWAIATYLDGLDLLNHFMDFDLDYTLQFLLN